MANAKSDELSGKVKFKAAQGKVLPVFHGGKLVRITPDEAAEFEWEKCSYDTKVILRRGLADKEIVKV